MREVARTLLREGKMDEAVKLLNDCFDRQYAEADALMSALYAAAKEKLKASTAEKSEISSENTTHQPQEESKK